MAAEQKNYAFIDGNNLYLGAKTQNIHINYQKLRKYLREKYKVTKAYLFIGYTQEQTELYSKFENYDKAIIITSDGDFACLMRYLTDKNKLKKIIVPSARYSKLLKPYKDYILMLDSIKNQIR